MVTPVQLGTNDYLDIKSAVRKELRPMDTAKIEIYQWLVPAISVIFIIRTVLQFVRKKRGHQSVIIWSVFWGTIILLSFIPASISTRIAILFGFKNNVNAIIFVALGWLFILVFFLSATIERLELKITELVRELALRDSEAKEND